MGENTKVYKGNGKSYQMDLGFYKDIPTGTLHYVYYNFYMKESADIDENIDWDNYDYTFAQALQVSQAVIFASKYVKEMSGENIASISVRYPHNEKKIDCAYIDTNKTKYISEPNSYRSFKSYASWDLIMHEYGHHVQYELSIAKSPGDNHNFLWCMGDHYMRHFNQALASAPTTPERNCTGCAAATKKLKNQNLNYKEIELHGAKGGRLILVLQLNNIFLII